MSQWGGGYVTDITYSMGGWYRQQSPMTMALASIIGGASAQIPTADDKITMLELGCGFGYTAMVLAASNPNWSITAVDFNPAHIAGAREWAAEAGLTNVTFVEADLSTWEDNPALNNLPQMDFVTMHGVWSWIPPAAKTGIVRLLREKVRPGGLVHLSYNSLPAWQGRMGAARIIREVGLRTPGRSDEQARGGLGVLKALTAAEAHFTSYGASVTSLIEMLDKASGQYIAHEYMNMHWQPCFVTDVAAALSDAKLEWVAAGNLMENFPELNMTEQQRQIFDRFSDPLMQELIKDMCTPRSLRHDVFVRGAQRLNLSARAAALMDVWLTLVKLPEELPDSVLLHMGKAELSPRFYGPIVQALSSGPKRVGDLLNLPEVVGRRDNPAELISILTTVEMVEPTTRPGADPDPRAMRFNTVSSRRMTATESPHRPVAAACHALGGPVITPLMALALVEFVREGITDVDAILHTMRPNADQEAEVRSSVEACLTRFLPVLKSTGVY